MRFTVALAAAAILAMPASAVTLFSQNFDSAIKVNNATNIAGFTVTGGVDVLGSGSSGVNCVALAGRCLDLVGSPNAGSITSSVINFSAGTMVVVTFDVSGNQRLTGTDNFNFALTFTNPENIVSTSTTGFQSAYGSTGVVSGFGLYNETVNRTRPFLGYVLSFIPTSSGSFRLLFASTQPNDARGPVLDNVLVESFAVPEPNTWAMLLAGFGFVGLAARRRRRSVAA